MVATDSVKLDAQRLVRDIFEKYAIDPENVDFGIIARIHEKDNLACLYLREHLSEEITWVRLEVWPSRKDALERKGTPQMEILAHKRPLATSFALLPPWSVNYRMQENCDITFLWFADCIREIFNHLCELVRSGEYDIEVYLEPPKEVSKP